MRCAEVTAIPALLELLEIEGSIITIDAWNKTTKEVRFYLSSLASNAEKIASAIRSHWGIENSLHWTLDVTFSEDKSRIRKAHSPENFALIRRLAINLLKQEKTFKGSLKMKRYLAGMDNNYLVQILTISSDLRIARYRFLRKISNAQLSFSVNLIKMRLPWLRTH
jgi:predicted transposase YbfD/YdcC